MSFLTTTHALLRIESATHDLLWYARYDRRPEGSLLPAEATSSTATSLSAAALISVASLRLNLRAESRATADAAAR